ncbi:MAG: efflux RND transporter periplasmic adaptor subunit [Tannerellaceae bacterium]|nr:efflux RND transporter periplasmic adaptor subunit [Tannerellaceae bacterium]
MKRAIASCLFLSFTLMVACESAEKAKTDQPEEVTALQEPVEAGINPDLSEIIPEDVYLNGTIVLPPQGYASVTPVMGGTVHTTNLVPGEYLRKGAVLATLENLDYINLQQTFLEAAAQSEFLETEYERQRRLSEQEAASKKRFQESKAEYLSMKSRKDAAAAQLRMLDISPEELLREGMIRPYLEIKAPISGYVTSMKLNVGKFFQPGEAICELVDKGRILLKMTAYEKDLPYLTSGEKITFVVNGVRGKEFEATVLSIGQEVDVASRSLEVYARADDNHELFRPGMYVTARINKK